MNDYISAISTARSTILPRRMDRSFFGRRGIYIPNAIEGTLSAKSKRALRDSLQHNAVKRLRALCVLYTGLTLETGYILSAIADEALLIESLRVEVRIFDLRETRV